MEKIVLAEKPARVAEPWRPHVVAELNGQMVQVVKLLGEFVWHHHEAEDELFHVLSGRLELEFRDRTVVVGPGEMIVVPRGVEHRPVAPVPTSIVLFEPASTLNTGNLRNARTVDELPRI
jgi:mannose-6-phosphate isomerase-like protein (cupin superfamily)